MQKFKVLKSEIANATFPISRENWLKEPDFLIIEGELLEGGTVERCCERCAGAYDNMNRPRCITCFCHNKKTDSSYLNQERLLNKINETLDFLGDFVTYLKSHEH